ncbi:MAG: hypothetical protein ABIW58_01810, partial [Sphingomicrobium sp.]
MKKLPQVTLSALSAAICTMPAQAQNLKVKPLLDLRLRYEDVDQDGIAREARALTTRVRAGAEFKTGPWSVLAEGEATGALSEKYFSGLNSRTNLPLVADPENIELNRLQLQYRGVPKLVATVGRQRINLEDQRFVGSVGWRQNEQTF